MAWYEKSFGSDYLLVYRHRDMQGARHEVKAMIDWLGLPDGAAVLDLCCGMGRHSLALADFGYLVTGVDLSGSLLAEARRQDAEGRVRWIRGDMRNVPLQETFDAVVNLFTSFGYFDDDDNNGRVLREIARLAKPGGRFIIDYLNPDDVRRRLVPHSERTQGELCIDETRRIEGGFVRKRIVLREPGQPSREYEEQVRLYDLPQLTALAEQAGLRVGRVYGGYDGQPFSALSSPRMILVGSVEERGTAG